MIALYLMVGIGTAPVGPPVHVGNFPTMDACKAAATQAKDNQVGNFPQGGAHFVCVQKGRQ